MASSSSDTQAVLQVSSAGELHQPCLLQSIGYCAFELARTFVKRAACLPFPLGAFTEVVKDAISPWIYPLFLVLEGHSLCLLAFFDDQIYALGTMVESYLPISSETSMRMQRLRDIMEQSLFALPGLLNKRGFVGICSDLWVWCECSMRECAWRSGLTRRIPMLRFVVCIFYAIPVPIAGAISDWLVEKPEEAEKQYENTSSANQHTVDAASENIDMNMCNSKKIETAANIYVNMSDSIQKEENLYIEFEKKAEKDNNRNLDSEDEKAVDPLVQLLDSSWTMGSLPSKKHP